jgi:hypothetical protein
MQVTIEELKELIQSRGGTASHSLELGKSYLIRTVTLYYVGRLVAVTDSDLVLADAAWVADTGRFANALRSGTLNEVEPFIGNAIVFRGGLIDATEWSGRLPADQK